MTERDIGMQGSLFERVGNAARSSRRLPSPGQLLQSIRRNLENVLNTRSGSCYGSPELGIPDLNDDALVSSDFRQEIGRGIRDCILRYEPRLFDVTVDADSLDVSAPQELRFHIVAQVSFNDASDLLEFEILLDNRQRYRVE
ncbi:type VI secretion system baseplate subunit TssE [Citrobacter werkmanii]|uniref:type VI secretion system baseplate subunit TssE n=1 Tax=Citrobacter werkmanii TaxID=67827 RepID=UPI00076EE2E0|nr:type VI secretion system baseplate subunit TssE [Citrobacter werkmanii]MDN8554828.1 type VI secretion system baseplate subunit TssE [Citrobacter werkmanii]GAS74969.1 gene 25-like lysozyme [Salmonella enterica]GAS77270.1 gene 25-like lysozyme [Salmonella enterica]